MTHTLLRYFYSVLLCLLLPLLLIVFRKKFQHTDSLLAHRKFNERFGKIPIDISPNGIHIHCVSVGEINAAKGLIEGLLAHQSQSQILITTSSVTGALQAHNLFKDRVKHCYLPIDLPWFMKRFYRSVKPRISIITELEVWPNMVHQCVKHGAALVLINARMTTKSLQNYRKLAWLLRPTFREFNLICAQSTESFNNFLSFGVYKKQLLNAKNMKFDLQSDPHDESKGAELLTSLDLKNKTIFLAASTHEPEEKLCISIFNQLRTQHNKLVMIIVPRHPHRFDDVFQLVEASGLLTQRLSKLDDSHLENIDCLLVDAMGWLKACYSVCDFCFVGGSFAPKGGHNALEAALYSKPIIMGPSQFNNPIICQQLQDRGALVTAENESEFLVTAQQWLDNQQKAELAGKQGFEVLQENAGAVEFTFNRVLQLLKEPTEN